MTGYTRQSIAEIAIDEEVKAEPLNAEFNALADAFNSSSGHAHDGTSGSGPRISLSSSVTGNLPATNIANNSIPYVKLENIANNKVLGNVSGSTASISPVDILDEDNMVSNRSDALPTQQSVKAYVDALDGAVVDAIEVLTDAIDAELEDVYDYVDNEVADLQAEITAATTNKICFMANKNNVNQATADTITKVTFGTEVFDIGSYYDTTNSRWTPPAGRYRISAQFEYDIGSGERTVDIHLYKNGSVIYTSSSYGAGVGSDPRPSISILVQANGTDYFEIFHGTATQGGSGNGVIGNTTLTWFCGEQV